MANTRSLITRSQATELVEFYYKSKYVLVKFQSLCNLSDIFDNTALSKKDKLISSSCSKKDGTLRVGGRRAQQ